jgi:hexokinase
VLDELGLSHATDRDCNNVRYVCERVSRRAAHLVSAGAATLINKMGQKNVTVGIDGSVYRFHPHFHDLMTEKIAQLVTPGIKVSSTKEKVSAKILHILSNMRFI